jgi:hypothetical protein
MSTSNPIPYFLRDMPNSQITTAVKHGLGDLEKPNCISNRFTNTAVLVGLVATSIILSMHYFSKTLIHTMLFPLGFSSLDNVTSAFAELVLSVNTVVQFTLLYLVGEINEETIKHITAQDTQSKDEKRKKTGTDIPGNPKGILRKNKKGRVSTSVTSGMNPNHRVFYNTHSSVRVAGAHGEKSEVDQTVPFTFNEKQAPQIVRDIQGLIESLKTDISKRSNKANGNVEGNLIKLLGSKRQSCMLPLIQMLNGLEKNGRTGLTITLNPSHFPELEVIYGTKLFWNCFFDVLSLNGAGVEFENINFIGSKKQYEAFLGALQKHNAHICVLGETQEAKTLINNLKTITSKTLTLDLKPTLDDLVSNDLAVDLEKDSSNHSNEAYKENFMIRKKNEHIKKLIEKFQDKVRVANRINSYVRTEKTTFYIPAVTTLVCKQFEQNIPIEAVRLHYGRAAKSDSGSKTTASHVDGDKGETLYGDDVWSCCNTKHDTAYITRVTSKDVNEDDSHVEVVDKTIRTETSEINGLHDKFIKMVDEDHFMQTTLKGYQFVSLQFLCDTTNTYYRQLGLSENEPKSSKDWSYLLTCASKADYGLQKIRSAMQRHSVKHSFVNNQSFSKLQRSIIPCERHKQEKFIKDNEGALDKMSLHNGNWEIELSEFNTKDELLLSIQSIRQAQRIRFKISSAVAIRIDDKSVLSEIINTCPNLYEIEFIADSGDQTRLLPPEVLGTLRERKVEIESYRILEEAHSDAILKLKQQQWATSYR